MANNDDGKFTNINPEELPEELKASYKSMQADYTRKTQALAERDKELSSKLEEQAKLIGAYERDLSQWQEWYNKLEAEPIGDQPTGQSGDDPLDDYGIPDYLRGDDDVSAQTSALHKKIAELEGKLTSVTSGLRDVSGQTQRMFSYHTQLNDLQEKYGKFDRKALLEFAVQHGETDLESAYDKMFRDDIISKQVEARVEERLKEMRTKGITGPGAPRQTFVRRNADKPMTFDAATESVLRDMSEK